MKPAKPEPPRYDAVVKDVFHQDPPTLLQEWANGARVVESLNVEFAKVIERRTDLLLKLSSERLLLLDFQAANARNMPVRVGVYGLLAHEKYTLPVDAVVVYIGSARLRMRHRLDIGCAEVSFRLIDIRDVECETLLRSGRPGDLVLAMLAKGGVENLRRILEEVARLPVAQRDRVLSQMALLSGLRRLTQRFKMEVAQMGATINIEKHVILREIREVGRAQGKAEGKVEGKAEGKAELIVKLLTSRFGVLPKWAATRIEHATPLQLDRWADRLLTADSIEAVIGSRTK